MVHLIYSRIQLHNLVNLLQGLNLLMSHKPYLLDKEDNRQVHSLHRKVNKYLQDRLTCCKYRLLKSRYCMKDNNIRVGIKQYL